MELIKTLITQFALRMTRSRRARRRVVSQLTALVDDHFEHPARCDGRGRKAKELRAVEKALRHMIHAIGWQDQQDLDLNVRREAQKLVETVRHGQGSFEDLMERASRLRGRVNRSGKERNTRMPVKGCEPLHEGLRRDFAVKRLHTTELLGRAGRALGNCAKDNGDGLHDKLRLRESDFYLVLNRNDPVAMFEVDLETDKITQFFGQRNDPIELPRRVLLTLLDRLQLDGDAVKACLQRGAASIFATGAGDIDKPDLQRGNLAAWYSPRRLVIKEEGERVRWSSFEWDGQDWLAPPPKFESGSRQYLDALMTHYPRLARLAHKAVKSGRK